MAQKTAPLFRKSMSGYNKEDVNNYIININRTLEDNKKAHNDEVEALVAKEEESKVRIKWLETEVALLEEKIAKLSALEEEIALKNEEIKALSDENKEMSEKIASLEKDSSDKDKEIEELKIENEKLATAPASSGECAEFDRQKIQQYDSLCAKAGEILVIAGSTAEDILKKANDEALRIVGEANDKKDRMLKTFSDSVDAAADDINTYIKSAVSACVKKINNSVKEVSALAAKQKAEKPKAVFIKGN